MHMSTQTLQDRGKLKAYIQSWPDMNQLQNKQVSYINTAIADKPSCHMGNLTKLQVNGSRLYSPVSSSWKRSLKSNQDKHCKYCAISPHSCLQKKFLSPYQTLHFWKNSCCIFISVYSKMKDITYERTVNLTTVNECKDNKINILLTKIICVKVLLFINPLPHAAYVEYLLKSCQLYVLHSLLCFCNR